LHIREDRELKTIASFKSPLLRVYLIFADTTLWDIQ
jgi:hypothetical protein